MMEHLNFRAIPISRQGSRVKCSTHTLLRVVMLESESLIIRGKLKGLTALRALSVCLIKSDASAKLAGSNLWVSWKSIWKLYEVFTTFILAILLVNPLALLHHDHACLNLLWPQSIHRYDSICVILPKVPRQVHNWLLCVADTCIFNLIFTINFFNVNTVSHLVQTLFPNNKLGWQTL